MLINFTFQNYRSIKDERTLSFEAASIHELEESVIDRGKQSLLPVTVIYGANSSGKSNVLAALITMRDVLLDSVKLNPTGKLSYTPFALDTQSREKPTSFEIQILIQGVRYRYGFDYDRYAVHREWLYEKPAGEREYNLFLRAGTEFQVSKARFPEGIGKEESTPKNRLFLSLVSQLNGKKALTIMGWFERCNAISGMNSWGYEQFTKQMFHEHREGYQEALEFFHQMGLGFNDIETKERSLEEYLERFPLKMLDKIRDKTLIDIMTTHNIYDENEKVVRIESFSKDEMESEGTKKMIEMSGPIFDALINGELLIIDELDSKLHPLLTRSIVRLFMDPQRNTKGAQLLFATHDTNLLNLKYLRRDQIWFTEKNLVEATDLYSLVEFKGIDGKKVRNDRDIENDYINGRYGAIPFIR
ncbi:MAG: ATP-binding protein [Mediterranea sp.]|jgi:AAA15 family ATPase/GTPase|nr:ATP-binding protein [Mediterranea sp.]